MKGFCSVPRPPDCSEGFVRCGSVRQFEPILDTQQVVGPGITEQTTRVLENLKAILEAAGSSLARVVKATVYLKDFNDFAAMNAVYGAYLAPAGIAAPARTTVEVSRLPKDVLVEIDLVAEV